MKFDVIIIGAGLMGFSSALQLSLRGQSCLVLDKDAAGRHASGVNAGGLRRLNRHPAEIPLSVAAAQRWQNISDLVGSDCDARFPGQVRIAENDEDMEKLCARANLVSGLGYNHEQIIDATALYRMVPELKQGCVGALYCEGDGYARPYHALTAFRTSACQLGTEYRPASRVLGALFGNGLWTVTTEKGSFSARVLLNCAGAWANEFAKLFGEAVPMEARAPMMMVTERLPYFLEPVIGAASRKLSFKQMQNGTLLIGGAHLATLDFEKEQTQLDWRKLAVSARTVLTLFPQLKDVRIVRAWAGIEGFTTDGLPVISPSSTSENLFHCFGFSAHGFQLSPIVGEVMADLVIKGDSELPISPFSIDRFSPNQQT